METLFRRLSIAMESAAIAMARRRDMRNAKDMIEISFNVDHKSPREKRLIM